jgi:hypothetical protein
VSAAACALVVFSAGSASAAKAVPSGGQAPSYLLPAAVTAAHSNKLGGYPAAALGRRRTRPTANTDVPEGLASGYTSVTIGADGLPVVSYRFFGVLDVLHCGDLACGADNSFTPVDSEVPPPCTGSCPPVDGPTSTTIGADRLPLIGYYDAIDSALKVAHCGNAACNSGNTITTVDSGGVGAGSSITVGADGLPLISYSANTNELRVIRCGNEACSSDNSISTVDTIPPNPETRSVAGTSVTIGVAGLPLVTYDISDGVGSSWVGVVHCGNAVCSAGNTLTTVKSGGMNFYASVTIGADGLPLISDIDVWYGFVMVDHCPNTSCLTTLVKLDISKNGTGSGTVSSVPTGIGVPTGIDCGPTCSELFYTGSWVTLTATPSEGSRFSGWSGGGCSGTGSCQIKNIARAQTVTAAFNLIPKCITPKLQGKTLRAAEHAITTHHCALGQIKHAASPTITKGHVISQKPKPGKRLANRAKINLVVSKGRH